MNLLRALLLLVVLSIAACDSNPAPEATPTAPLAPTVTAPPVASVPPAAPTRIATATATQPTPAATASLPPTPTELPPPRPGHTSEIPQTIAAYLSAQPDHINRLKGMLAGWGWSIEPPPYGMSSDVMMRGDVNGDGQGDVVLALGRATPATCEIGALLLFLGMGSGYRFAQQIGLLEAAPIDPRISHIPCPTIFALRDLTNSGTAQVVYASIICGAHTCNVSLGVLRWSGTDLRPVMTEPLPTMAYPEVTLVNGPQGRTDIVMHGGIVASLGAGPQRERREVYRWNGTRFALADRTYDASNYLYFKVSDANVLMRQKQLAQAITLYQEAINNPNLELSGMRGEERADLQAFSRFRLVVAYTLLGDASKAKTALDEFGLKQRDHLYYDVAQTYWGAYLAGPTVAGGCAAVSQLAQGDPALTGVLSDFGYTNPDLRAEEVCPFL